MGKQKLFYQEQNGFVVQGDSSSLLDKILERVNDDRLEKSVDIVKLCDSVEIRAKQELMAGLGPELDTSRIPSLLGLESNRNTNDLTLEILIALSACPVPITFRDISEFEYGVNVRRNIVQESLKTQLAFSTEDAERPSAFWNYSEETGFVVKAGQSLIKALRAATQPIITGKKYAFSCYRATEYVILLSIALELEQSKSPLLDVLQRQMERSAIKSRRFHDVFLHEYGSMRTPLPLRFYIPGERVWFRNPDHLSSDVEGYEGSWVFYLGQGLFTNFWKDGQAYTLESKAIELFHWRNGVFVDGQGKIQIDESVVDTHVMNTMSETALSKAVFDRMLMYRDPSGMYGKGGCIDTTREYPRYIGVKFDYEGG